MADEVRAEWTGLQDLLSDLRELPQAIQKRVLKGTLATGARIIRDEARRLAPVYVEFNTATGDFKPISDKHPPAGTLKKAIYFSRLVGECTSTRETWIVGVHSGKKFRAVSRGSGKGRYSENQDAFYASWVEYGHYTRTPGMTSQQHRKARGGVDIYLGARWIPPQPFMRPAFDLKKEAAFQAMREYLLEHLPAAATAARILQLKAA